MVTLILSTISAIVAILIRINSNNEGYVNTVAIAITFLLYLWIYRKDSYYIFLIYSAHFLLFYLFTTVSYLLVIATYSDITSFIGCFAIWLILYKEKHKR